MVPLSETHYQNFFQNDEDHDDKFATYSDLEVKWSKGLGDFFCSEETKEKVDCDLARPDSGVGESVRKAMFLYTSKNNIY